MNAHQKQVQRAQIFHKMCKARDTAKRHVELLSREWAIMGPQEVEAQLKWIEKHTADWKLWASVYEQLYDIGVPLQSAIAG